ncbi:MAG TPA: thiamine-phosphate kinase [Acidimicrobiales bacterium]|nr:thiamine-phosphate kinase [Acidimicrobiales bacterium]
MDTGEFELIAELRRRFPLVGDDAAVVDPPAGRLLLAADAIVGGIDFTDDEPLEQVGYRAVLVNASDIAAMGGQPLHVVVSIVAPPGADVLRIVEGIAEGVRVHGCEVAGGDLSSTAGPLVVSVAITGTIDDGGAAVLRSGARAGDGVFVTGPLGSAAAAGYRFGDRWSPRARIAEGRAARLAGATAMIDVSDGFAADLGHLLDASGVGVVLESVPVAEGATDAQALGGGDDYELVFTLPAVATVPSGAIGVGQIVDDPSKRPPAVPGWQHRFS